MALVFHPHVPPLHLSRKRHSFPLSTLLNPTSPSSSSSSSSSSVRREISFRLRKNRFSVVFSSAQGKEDTDVQVVGDEEPKEETDEALYYVRQIQKVLDLLKKNRNMLFSEVKLTIMIEDPRDSERKRLLGIEDDVTRDDLGDALEKVNDGKIPENRAALRMLAEEMINWPNLEVAAPKSKPSKSPYAKVTDTGVDPKLAAKRLNMDWDLAADYQSDEESDEAEVPPAVGYGVLYLVSALPILIGVGVVLILFYNSLQ